MAPAPVIALATVVERLRAAGCVFAEDEARLLLDAAPTAAALRDMLTRRMDGVPLEQVLGWAEFCGRRYHVDPGVFVPRRRTEFLVRTALALPAAGRHARVAVDLCCGTGAVGIAVAERLQSVELHSADVDPRAVACARRNLIAFGFDPRVYAGDLFAALPVTLVGRIDLLIANVPYVPTAAIALLPPEARDHEPRTALDGGPDGLDLARRVFAGATGWLRPGGQVLIEASENQASVLAVFGVGQGLEIGVATDDDLDATVVMGTRPAAQGA